MVIGGGLLLAVGVCLAGASRLEAAAELSRQQQIELLNRAVRSFEQATAAAKSDPRLAERRYRDAATWFESLIESGVANGKLHYNLGNAYLRLSQIGRAILAYRRAERLVPGDDRLAENLRFARSIRKNRIPQRQESVLLQRLFFWHYGTRTKVRASVGLALYVLAWALLFAHLRWRTATLRYAGAIALGGFIILVGSVFADEYRRSTIREGVIVQDNVIARKGDGETYEPQFKDALHQGVEFELLESRGTWLHVELPDGKDAWIPARVADFI